MELNVVILAAGQGTRMRSDLPKVLHTLGGFSLLSHVVKTAIEINAQCTCVVYGHAGDQVLKTGLPVVWVEQAQQLGTGHAVAQALPFLPETGTVLILYGDVPLIQPKTLQTLLSKQSLTPSLALLTVVLPDPKGYGRILRNVDGQVIGIVEEKDATPEQRVICEINTGILASNKADLTRWIQKLNNHNSQKEYYLTDTVGFAVAEGIPVYAVHPETISEVLGVNSRAQLAELERVYQSRQAQMLMSQGVTLRDPARLDVRGTIETGKDVEIDIDVILEGEVNIGDRVRIGPYCYLKNVTLSENVEIRAHSVLEGVTVGTGSAVGPFARLRPGTELGPHVHVGNFVEIKKSQIGERSKVNHLSYIGDAQIGSDVNIGAGTITCNYDGANKHLTKVGDRAFIGSNTALVAPVEIGSGATIGAGSIITKKAPPEELTLSRAPQETYQGWKRPIKKEISDH
ncbi:fused N-acetylglucosamine-1-phosphate uridyltransferase and glucosamine-1-phosphate acetyltransferase [Gammaproteobacteria bacterium]